MNVALSIEKNQIRKMQLRCKFKIANYSILPFIKYSFAKLNLKIYSILRVIFFEALNCPLLLLISQILLKEGFEIACPHTDRQFSHIYCIS